MSGDSQSLCEALVRAESEKEVISILKRAGHWDTPSSWRNYGDNPMNFSSIGNQQSRPESALVEKLINSVDAMLMRECLLQGFNPEDTAKVPSTIQEATEVYFGVKRGDLSNLPSDKRSELAESIILVATGEKAKPCYLVIDRGEGQTPDRFPDTLLSLNKENKVRIPFVQGKFNMGSTGVLPFCGEDNLQLIISRKHHGIVDKKASDASHDEWGFTVVRRMRPTGSMKSSVYRYLAPNGRILRFHAESIKVLPGEYPRAYDKPLEWGTVVKLYEYDIRGFKTNILFDLYNRLSLMIPEVALPLRLYERREGYTGHSFETTLAGLTVRLKDDRSGNLEPGFPSSSTITVHGERMPCSIYAFKKGTSEKYVKDEGIVFIVNGQAHAFMSNSFYRRNSVGMSYLRDSILILVDCSKLGRDAMEDLFMNSRDRLRDVELRTDIESKLEQIVHDHPGLRELRERRRREEISERLDESRPLVEVLEKIIKKSPALTSLLITGTSLSNPFKLEEVNTRPVFEGKTFPTYFRLRSPPEKESPINRRFRMQFETDVMNDYFDRVQWPGQFRLFLEGTEIYDYVLNLWNGIANLNVEMPATASVGQVLRYKTEVQDKDQYEPFTSEFQVSVLPAVETPPSGGNRRIQPPGSKPGSKRQTSSQLALPHIEEIYREKWNGKYDEYSALRIEQADENKFDFYVNMDNRYLLAEIKSRTKVDPRLLRAQYKYALVIFDLGLLHHFMKSESDNEEEEEEGSFLEKIEVASRWLAAVLLPVLNDLSELVELEETE